jgi:hypothetical protein
MQSTVIGPRCCSGCGATGFNGSACPAVGVNCVANAQPVCATDCSKSNGPMPMRASRVQPGRLVEAIDCAEQLTK